MLGRNTHDNTAYRYLPGEHNYSDCGDTNYRNWAIGYEYNSTFNSADLARCLFGRQTLSFKGSQVAGRDPNVDLIADYFGLASNFQGTVTFRPKIQNNSIRLESFHRARGCAEGLYFRADLTFTNQRRSLYNDACSSCISTSVVQSSTFFCPGYMSQSQVPTISSIPAALSGNIGFGNGQGSGLAIESLGGWQYGKFSCFAMNANQIAGFSVDLGYDFIRRDCSHLGVFIRYVAPTGTRLDGSQKNASNVFFPIVGNGHHHELGGGLTFHYDLWSNDCGDSLSLYFDGYATHLFKDCQIRSFDFVGKGCLSRYMLLKELRPTTTAAGFDATGTFISGINFATRNVESSISVQGDASLRLIYSHNGFSLGLGYNAFGRKEESLCLKPGNVCAAIDPSSSYGFKGCEGVAYFAYGVAAGVLTGPAAPVTSNATSSNATITNCGTVDSPVAVGSTTGTTLGVDWRTCPADGQVGATATAVRQAFTSAPATTVSLTDLDINSGKAARLFTNKGFLTLNYMWEDCESAPYLGVGAEAEGGSRCCDIRQWGVWLKGGLSF